MVRAATNLALIFDALLCKLLAGLRRAHYRCDGARGLVRKHRPEPDDNIFNIPRRKPALFVEGRERRAYVLVHIKTPIRSVELDVGRLHGVLVRQHDHAVKQSTFERRIGWTRDGKVHVCNVLWICVCPEEYGWVFFVLSELACNTLDCLGVRWCGLSSKGLAYVSAALRLRKMTKIYSDSKYIKDTSHISIPISMDPIFNF